MNRRVDQSRDEGVAIETEVEDVHKTDQRRKSDRKRKKRPGMKRNSNMVYSETVDSLVDVCYSMKKQ